MGSKAMAGFGLAAGAIPPALALALALVPEASPATPPVASVEMAVADATVTLLPSRCAGAVVEDGWHVATVAHCVRGNERLRIQLSDGSTLAARVSYRDEERDHVILELDRAAGVAPIPIADELPAPGDRLYFGSRPDRPMPAQAIEVTKIARCPSLPGVEGAIFTTLDARPGDSGSPLVDESGALAGMVHGGARCQISTPAAGLGAAVRPAG